VLVAAMNPCGPYGDPAKECTCSPSMPTGYHTPRGHPSVLTVESTGND
jgi:predicted ATPase with chaperone activity